MQIQIKDSGTSDITTIDIDDNDTIHTIKQKLGGLKGIDPSALKLVFNGKSLIDNQTASAYDIKEGSIIHQVLQLQGGC